MTAIGGALSMDRLRADGDRFMEEISRALYLAGSGHAVGAALQPIYAAHSVLFDPDTLGMVREVFLGAAPTSEDHRSARVLLEWLAEAQASRALAPVDEREIAWEGSAIVQLEDGRGIEYERSTIEIANTTDVAERRAIERARYALIAAELVPLRQERLQRERDITDALDLAGDYNATFERLSGVGLTDLQAQCRAFLRDTQGMWNDTHAEFVKRRLGIDPREATRGDAIALFRAREFDAYFPGREREARITAQVAEMGIDPAAGGRIVLDTAEREGKRSRAFCAPVRVPDEVYLVLRPHGGQGDWTTFLHEMGHALHFGYIRPDLPFEYRWLGDNSVTESFAMLFDHLMHDRGWLRRYTDLGAPLIPSVLRAAAFDELHYLRRYSAKLLYEVQLYGGQVPWRSLPDLYVHELTAATNFRYDPSEAFVDVDSRFYSARYLRAWQLQNLLGETLVARYDQDWWRNPRAGPWMCADLFAEGQRELGDELALRVAGKKLGFEALVRRLEQVLA